MLDLVNLDEKYLLSAMTSLFSQKIDQQSVSLNSNIPRLTKPEISGLCRKSKIISRIIYDYPKTAYSNGFNLNIDAASFDNNAFKDYLDSIPVYTEINKTVPCYGIYRAISIADGLARKFGTAYIVMGFADGNELWEPLDIKKARELSFLFVYEQERLTGHTMTNDVYYGANSIRIHKSRVITVPGVELDSYEEFIDNQYYHDSVIYGLFEAFAYWKIAIQADSEMIESANIYGMGIENLGIKIKQDMDNNNSRNSDYVQNRAYLLARNKSVSKFWLYDKDKEEITNLTRNFSGIAENIETLKDFFASHTDMPRWRVFNEFGSSNGLANNVESARILNFAWQSSVQEYARDKYLKILDYFIGLLGDSRIIDIPDEYSDKDIIFPLGLKLTDNERLELANQMVDYYQKLISSGIRTLEDIQELFKDNEFAFILDLL